jgi:phosphate transport system substrate-binding protein
MVQITTTTGTIFRGEFQTESSDHLYWILNTSSGTTSVPKGAISQVQALKPVPQPVSTPTPVSPPSTPSCPASLELSIHGSNTIGEKLAPALARAFARKCGKPNEEIHHLPIGVEVDLIFSAPENRDRYIFHIKAHGSATAVPGLLAGAADIGMMSRRINDGELQAASSSLGDLLALGAENVIGLDGVAVVANQANPVKSLNLCQIASIFTGDETDWGKFGGGSGKTAQVYSRDEHSGTFDTFMTLVVDQCPQKLTLAERCGRNLVRDPDRCCHPFAPTEKPPEICKLIKEAKLFEDSEKLSDSVAGDTDGIGFVGFPYIRNSGALTVASPCGLRSAINPFSIKTEEYPISRRLYFYVPATKRNVAADAFLAFALSDDAQSVIKEAEFINLDIETAPNTYTMERGQYRNLSPGGITHASLPRLMQQFAERIEDAQRLSVTFRFKTASAELDNRAHYDIDRLAAYVNKTPGMVERLMLFGFADAVGNIAVNQELSQARANQIATALTQKGIAVPPAQVLGFGVIAPVACNDSEVSQQKNRRVEVWLRR